MIARRGEIKQRAREVRYAEGGLEIGLEIGRVLGFCAGVSVPSERGVYSFVSSTP